jgi:hypothetical protein
LPWPYGCFTARTAEKTAELYLSGRLAKKDGKPWSGKLGEQITTPEGKQAARGIAIELLATRRFASSLSSPN